MKKKCILFLMALAVTVGSILFVAGCSNLSANVFRTEQAATTVAYGAYVGYTNWLLTSFADPKLTADRKAQLVTISNQVKVARLRFAATVSTVEALRVQYETNSTLKPPLEAGLQTIIGESSNLCWLINYWRAQ